MASTRFILHPVLGHQRSRKIFFLYLALSITIGLLVNWKMDSLLHQAGIYPEMIRDGRNGLASILLSTNTRLFLVLFSALIAGTLTAKHVVGPVNRIRNWLEDWEKGIDVPKLAVRKGDKFSDLVRLLNEFRDKIQQSRQ